MNATRREIIHSLKHKGISKEITLHIVGNLQSEAMENEFLGYLKRNPTATSSEMWQKAFQIKLNHRYGGDPDKMKEELKEILKKIPQKNPSDL